MITEKRVNKLIDTKLQETDLFLVELSIRQGNKIQVFIDGDSGVTIHDCKMLSRFLESEIDRDTEDFELHVSSSGLDKPLKLFRQYKKNIGRRVEVTFESEKPISGKLITVSEEEIVLEKELKKKKKKDEVQEDPKVTIPISEIKQTLVIISFK